jgi:hypothetical protein
MTVRELLEAFSARILDGTLSLDARVYTYAEEYGDAASRLLIDADAESELYFSADGPHEDRDHPHGFVYIA